MLPATLVTLATFLLEICTTSPVYNMQPAFITANIGTNGRNIRNLPCISRKNNQSGVCMFAIDCLKSNGTHLGTCIDRFYFGSCCHIEPVVHHDIADNTIDNTDIIPAREPPNRLAITTGKPVLISSTTLENKTSFGTTTTEKIVTSQKITKKNATTTTKLTTTSSTSKPIDVTTTVGYKLTTFQSVDAETTTPSIFTTSRSPTAESTTSRTITTRKPTVSTKATPRPKPTKTSSKPTKATPSTTIRTRTKSTTKRPITKKPTKPSGTTKITAKTTTTKPTTVTTKKPVVVTTVPTSVPTSSRPVAKPITKPPIIILTTVGGTQESATKKNVTIGNNEIELGTTPLISTAKPLSSSSSTVTTTTRTTTTTKPSVVTWSIVDDGKNTTTASSTVNISTTITEEWLSITTPDGWVLLPSVPSTSTGRPDDGEEATQTPSSTPTTIGISSSVDASSSSSTTTTSNNGTTEEDASKPSITYIPLDVTTSSPTNATAALNTNVTTPSSSLVTSTAEATTTNPTLVNLTTTTTTTQSSVLDLKPVNMSDFTDVCGRRMFPEARIVGGEKASFGKWPWQISLRQWRTSTYLHKCGAALLNENWAITAAHCVDNVPPSDLLLRLGEHDLSTESEPYLHQERRVQIVASHPQFDPRTFEYDLALLRFYEPVTFQPNILPVCVPQNDENFVGRTAHVTGWGRLYEDGPLPSILQEVTVPVINNSVCESMYRSAGYIEHIPHIFICAGWRRGGFDSCEGDSGGPMVIQREDKRFLLAGVISWGIGCAEPNQPGVYTRISEFKDWINQILQF